VQRRRRKKVAPKNVFGSSSQPSQSQRRPLPSQSKSPRGRARVGPPPSVPGSKIKPKVETPKITTKQPVKSAEEPIVESPIIVKEEEIAKEEKTEEAILEGQLLGKKSRKDIGLDKQDLQTPKLVKSDDEKSSKSTKARQIIHDSMIKASIAAKEEKTRKATEKKPKPVTPETPKKPQRKFRNKNTSYQPANRARRLDRSRHMEYKYEMRRTLEQIGVLDEYRSSILATVWARGERQTSKEANDFLMDKLSEGIIDEEQLSILKKMVDGYTIRR